MSVAGSTGSVAGSACEERLLHDNITLMQALMLQYREHCVFMTMQLFKDMDAEQQQFFREELANMQHERGTSISQSFRRARQPLAASAVVECVGFNR